MIFKQLSVVSVFILALSTPFASGQTINEDLKITASDAAVAYSFGQSVAVSGTTAIVGASSDDAGLSSGSAYLFDITTGQELFKLTASDAAEYDYFGISVAISGTTAIVGASGDDDGGQSSGSAYVFDTTTGQQLFKLTASDATESDKFGESVAISGTTAIVGAWATVFGGSAYLFDTTTGQELFKLTASDAGFIDRFGSSVAISGTTAIVGAFDADAGAGSAYLFDTTTGQQLFKLTASDAEYADSFGHSVAITGTTAIVGASLNDDDGVNSGSAYLFDTTTGQQLFKLTASDAADNDRFGTSVSISGTTAIVGAMFDADGGSAYLIDTTTGDQLAKLKSSDAAPGDRFGTSVSISGRAVIVGAVYDDDAGSGSGSAYVFWPQDIDIRITAPDAMAGDYFGTSVGVSGTTAVVGASFDDDGGGQSGSVYLLDTTTGQETDKLTASDAAADDQFGTSVAIAGTTTIVGAVHDDDAGTSSGSAYLFDTATGQELFKLTASDAAAGDRFGISVSIWGTTAIVGASRNDDAGRDSGSAYLFDTTTGQQLFKLTASDAAADDYFGISVSIWGTTAIVGAGGDDDAGSGSGSAYLFDTTTGQELMKLSASDAAGGDQFGSAVGISGTTAIVGAYGDDDAGTESGSAYLFDTSTGQELFKLTAPDGTAFDWFGLSVAVSGTNAIVGARFDDEGSAYLFNTTKGQQISKLTAYDASVNAYFGASVAITEQFSLVGAPAALSSTMPPVSTGAAYLYHIEAPCPADLNNDGELDFLDISAFLNGYSMMDPISDLSGDGQFDFLDISAFLSSYNSGCP